ncbi:hypothetical protein KSP40_PGU009266 [Platanthera guangdongensis]|uniref:Uncharacterized protein n=1 Tax=Platanthera guangdongensis TaxID=2320717 RepID=A0ABR2LX06_9ASPA
MIGESRGRIARLGSPDLNLHDGLALLCLGAGWTGVVKLGLYKPSLCLLPCPITKIPMLRWTAIMSVLRTNASPHGQDEFIAQADLDDFCKSIEEMLQGHLAPRAKASIVPSPTFVLSKTPTAPRQSEKDPIVVVRKRLAFKESSKDQARTNDLRR